MPRRRELLASVGLLSTAGCLRLQGSESDPTPGSGGDTASGAAATEAPGTDAGTSADGTLRDAQRVALSERWAADFGVRYVRTDGGHFFFNGLNRAGEAVPGDGILWSDEVTYEGSSGNLGADVIASRDDLVVFGFFSERGSVEDPGAHFVAYGDVAGTERWSFTVPATEADGFTNLPRGAAITEAVVVVGVDPPGRQQSRVFGLDRGTGEKRWEREFRGFLGGVDAHDGRVYVAAQSGVSVLDPTTGSRETRHQSWRGSPARIHGDAYVVATAGDSAVHAHPLGSDGVEWSSPEIPEPETLVVDNSLVVVGTRSGGVHAVERATGERRWRASIDGTVWQVAQSARHVWVADRETGLTAFDRDDGATVHQSTQPINRSDIGVVSRTILFGIDTARAYDIEPA